MDNECSGAIHCTKRIEDERLGEYRIREGFIHVQKM